MKADLKQELIDRAVAVMPKAYAPYSGFHVGAALLCDNGDIITGINVENASFPVGNCAERTAIGAAVTQGHRSFVAIAIATATDEPTMPCGLCRQTLAEFGLDLQVICYALNTSQLVETSLGELLPYAYQGKTLERKS